MSVLKGHVIGSLRRRDKGTLLDMLEGFSDDAKEFTVVGFTEVSDIFCDIGTELPSSNDIYLLTYS